MIYLCFMRRKRVVFKISCICRSQHIGFLGLQILRKRAKIYVLKRLYIWCQLLTNISKSCWGIQRWFQGSSDYLMISYTVSGKGNVVTKYTNTILRWNKEFENKEYIVLMRFIFRQAKMLLTPDTWTLKNVKCGCYSRNEEDVVGRRM